MGNVEREQQNKLSFEKNIKKNVRFHHCNVLLDLSLIDFILFFFFDLSGYY